MCCVYMYTHAAHPHTTQSVVSTTASIGDAVVDVRSPLSTSSKTQAGTCVLLTQDSEVSAGRARTKQQQPTRATSNKHHRSATHSRLCMHAKIHSGTSALIMRHNAVSRHHHHSDLVRPAAQIGHKGSHKAIAAASFHPLKTHNVTPEKEPAGTLSLSTALQL